MMDNTFDDIKTQLDLFACKEWDTVCEAEAGVQILDDLLERLTCFIAQSAKLSPCDEGIIPAIILLAENGGCGTQIEKHENFIENLCVKGLLTSQQAKFFYENEHRRQG